jgi:uncharacterized membrane protein HdeD (DUF308 family)
MIETLSRNWWATVLRGLLAIGVGIFAWVRPDIFWPSLVLVFGVYAFVDGIFAILAAIRSESGDRWLHVLEGLAGIAIGAVVFARPEQVGTAIVLVIGLWALISGLLEIVAAVRLRQEIEGEWLLGLGGVLSMVLGVLLIAQPNLGRVTITYIVGTYGIVFGLILILLGLRLRGLQPAANAGTKVG